MGIVVTAEEEGSQNVAGGLEATFRLLADTPNEAAVWVLISALESPRSSIRESALSAILERRSPSGQQAVVQRLDTLDESLRGVIEQSRVRLTSALRDAVLGQDRRACDNAFEAIVWLREYDLMAALITVAEDPASEHADRAAETIVALAERLFRDVSAPRDYRERRDPQFVRRHVVESLGASVSRYPQHKRPEPVEAFLMLARSDDDTLVRILGDPRDASYLVLVQQLTRSDRDAVIGQVLGLVDRPHAPSAALAVVAHRADLPFVQRLLSRIGGHPSEAMERNLKRIESIVWLSDDRSLVDQLDESEQRALVRLVAMSGIRRSASFETIQHLTLHGTVTGRRAATAALADFSGADANALALRALEDEDPEVEALAVAQLRPRGIPGAMTLLLERVGRPHAVVRAAARGHLEEFSLPRYLAVFDTLSDEVRRGTGALVRRVDPESVPLLAAEMAVPVRTRRLRGIAAAEAMSVVAELDEPLLGLIQDEDHMIRAEAARALGDCDTSAVREALERALGDKAVAVQLAARESLGQLDRRLEVADPLESSFDSPTAREEAAP